MLGCYVCVYAYIMCILAVVRVLVVRNLNI
jgi:hypothetical protein